MDKMNRNFRFAYLTHMPDNMKYKLIILLLFSTLIQLAKAQFVTKINENNLQNHVISGNDTSHVDWTSQYVVAKGWSVIDTVRFKIRAQAIAMARQGAITDAQRNLLERIEGVRIVGETVVKDMITQNDVIYKRLEGVIKGAELVGSEKIDGLLVEVIMRVPIYQDKKGFAGIVQEGMKVKPEITENTGFESNGSEQVVFNMNGHKFDPALFPKIVDETNNVLLDYSKIYDPGSGKFPKFLNFAKKVFDATGFEKGTTVLNVIETVDGIIKVETDQPKKGKINWKKIGRIAGTIGGALLMFI
ncbi:MAG: hypothetical protein U0W24_21965 [Bacteroidales bacterium]